jgi:serine/threonine protein kinase
MLSDDVLEWCEENDVEAISRLQQQVTDSDDRNSEVWLIRDSDGLFKILKEIIVPPPDYLTEDEIYPCLPALKFIAKLFGTNKISGTKFLRRSFLYGQPLSDYCFKDNMLDKKDAFLVLSNVAEALYILKCNLLYMLDLQPENILISTHDIFFPDLGLSKFYFESTTVSALTAHPRYCAPETLIAHEANDKSMVFQLGIIAQEILTSKYPIKRVSLDNVEFNQYIENDLIAHMLEVKCKDRPTLEQCAAEFKKQTTSSFVRRRGIPILDTKDTILFPARMGIPHKGHIRYICALLDLGYKVIISIQRSFTISDRDPIQKYLVMKMVAQSLLDAGYSQDSFSFCLTPFFRTPQEMSLYFTMMPNFDNVVAVASSNPSILSMKCFPDNFITQQHLFGIEGQVHETLSWGEIIRTAVKNNDYKTFQEYAATGVEKILSFEELKKIYNIIPIEFVDGKAYAYVDDFLFGSNFIVQLVNYHLPEECIAEHYSKASIFDAYSKDSTIILYDKKVQLSYIKYDFNLSNTTLYFQLKPMEV